MVKTGLRVDQCLKYVCLFKSRNAAQQACKKGYIRVNGKPARPADRVAPGDLVEIDLPTRYLALRVLGVPARQVPCRQAGTYYEVTASRTREQAVSDLLDELLQEMGGEMPLD